MTEMRAGRRSAWLLMLAFVSMGRAAADDLTARLVRSALDAGEAAQAAEALAVALERDRGNVRTQVDLALALSSAGSHEDALERARAAAGAAPSNAYAAHGLALVHLARLEVAEALRVADHALARSPDAGHLALAKGTILARIKHTRSAIETLERATKNQDAVVAAEAWDRLGQIYYARGWEGEGAFPGWHDEPEFRERAIAAFRAAAAARPGWYRPHAGLGEALLQNDRPAEALTEFDAAIARGPNIGAARFGRWKTLKALGRAEEARSEIAAAAAASDPRLLDAARLGQLLLGRAEDAEIIAVRLVERFPSSDGAAEVLIDRLLAARAAKQPAAVIDQANAFAKRFRYHPRLPVVYDALLEAYQATPSISPEAIVSTFDARVQCRPDPGPYLVAAGLLASRGAMLDRVIQIADESIAVAETFINENFGAYKLADKARGSLARSRASATDMIGWALFLRKHLAAAESKLGEAERLSRGQDMNNQFHLGELARAKGELERAREHYLNALSLGAGAEAVRAAARTSLADVHTRLGNPPAEFEAYLRTELERRREERREALVRSMVDRPAPALVVSDIAGRQVELAAERGKVVLLNFFTSW